MALEAEEVDKQHCWAAEDFAVSEPAAVLKGGNTICMCLVEPDRKVG